MRGCASDVHGPGDDECLGARCIVSANVGTQPIGYIDCAADGCEGIASAADPYCTPECAVGRCPECGQLRRIGERLG